MSNDSAVATATEVSPDLEHFIDLAYRGRYAAASSGEQAAHKLAAAMIEYATSLDDKALDGAAKFLDFAKYQTTSARRIIGS